MQAFKNIVSFLKKCSITDLIKLIFVAGLLGFLAFFLMNFLLILIVVGVLIRLIAPYFGFKFSRVRFKHRGDYGTQKYKIVGEEEKSKEKNETKK